MNNIWIFTFIVNFCAFDRWEFSIDWLRSWFRCVIFYCWFWSRSRLRCVITIAIIMMHYNWKWYVFIIVIIFWLMSNIRFSIVTDNIWVISIIEHFLDMFT